MNTLISVIVPVYNVEKYLCTCLDSLITQTYPHLEIILVDDGSTDNGGRICDEYAAKDSRIIVIHQKNQGLSAARNAGLDIAQGEYVGFIDSDDWCEPHMFDTLMATAYCTHADIVACGAYIENETPDQQVPTWMRHTLTPRFLTSNTFSSRTFSVPGILPFVWNMLFEKSLIDSIGLTFDPALRLGEDTVFLKTILPFSKRTVTIPDQLYHYRYNRKASLSVENSEMRTLCLRHIEVISSLASSWSRTQVLEAQQCHFMKWALNYVFWQIEHLQETELACSFLKIWHEYNFDNSLHFLSKEELSRLSKIKEYANPDEVSRNKYLAKRERQAKLKKRLRSSRFTSELFDIYWHFKYKGVKSAFKAAKRILKGRRQSFYNDFIRDGVIFYGMALLRILRVPFALRPYKGILKVKNRHVGESCFIVAPGPSLTKEDVETIGNIPSFAVNGAIALHNMTVWKPWYYVLFDGRALKKILREEDGFDIESFVQKEAFINALLRNQVSQLPCAKNAVFVPYCNGGNSDTWNILKLRYTRNLLWGYYDLTTVTNAAIHIAQYMGFKKIYLLGVDCDYSSPKQYFTNTKNDNIQDFDAAQTAQTRMFKAYGFMKKKMDAAGVEVYNATRGGALEVFPRVDLDSVVARIASAEQPPLIQK